MINRKRHPPGPPMTLGNMRELGVHHLIAFCHSDSRTSSSFQISDLSVSPTLAGEQS